MATRKGRRRVSVVAQGFDGAEAGGFPGGPEAGDDADQRKNDEGNGDHACRHVQEDVALMVGGLIEGAIEGEGRYSVSEGQGEHNARQTPQEGQDQSFQQKLSKYVELPGAQGLTQ